MIKKIDHLFEEIKYHEQSPPPFVWEQIEAKLHRSSRKPIVAWWHSDFAKKSALLAGVLGAAIWSFVLSTYIKDPVNIVEDDRKLTEKSSKKVKNSQLNDISSSSNNSFPIDSQIDLFSSAHNIVTPISQSSYSQEIKNKKLENSPGNFMKNPDLTISTRTNSELVSTKEHRESIDIIEDYEWMELKSIGIDQILKNELTGNPSMMITNTKDYNPVLHQHNMRDASKATIKSGFYVTPSAGINITQVYFNSEVINPYFTSHATFSGMFGHQIGVQLGYQYNNHWSIESGIFYNQYQQSFKEYNSTLRRDGIMYIDQLDLPLMVRYSLVLKNSETPKVLSFKAGLNYGSVFYYQVNSEEMFVNVNLLKSNHYDLDKRVYNSIQLGYALGVDFDAYLSKRIAFNSSIGSVYQSQYTNFPFFTGENQRPSQLSGSFSVGIKFKF